MVYGNVVRVTPRANQPYLSLDAALREEVCRHVENIVEDPIGLLVRDTPMTGIAGLYMFGYRSRINESLEISLISADRTMGIQPSNSSR